MKQILISAFVAALVAVSINASQFGKREYIPWGFKKGIAIGKVNSNGTPTLPADSVALEIGDTLSEKHFLLPATERDSIRPTTRSLFYEKSKKRLWFSDGAKYYRLQIDSTVTP